MEKFKEVNKNLVIGAKKRKNYCRKSTSEFRATTPADR